MKQKETQVMTHFQCSKAWNAPSKVTDLLNLLEQYRDVGLSPNRYGSSDARTFELAELEHEEIEQTWIRVGGGHFKSIGPWKLSIHVFYVKAHKAAGISHIWLRLNASFFEDEDRVSRYLDLCKNIYLWGQMDHGFIASEQEYAQKNEFGPGRGVGGANLRVALPGIYWANFFGPVYAQWLGRERFRTLEAHNKEQLADGGWFLLTRPNVTDEFNSQAIRMRERQIIAHLGQEAFFEMEDPGKPTIAPDFWGTYVSTG